MSFWQRCWSSRGKKPVKSRGREAGDANRTNTAPISRSTFHTNNASSDTTLDLPSTHWQQSYWLWTRYGIMADQPKSLVSQKSSDSGLRIQLYPLILLSISDHITRHAARQQQGPIIGALLGQHNGREITLEHVFECIAVPGPNGEAQLPHDWFVERVKQCKQHLQSSSRRITFTCEVRC